MAAKGKRETTVISSSTIAEVGPDGFLDIRPASPARQSASPAVSSDDRRATSRSGGPLPGPESSPVNLKLPIDPGNSSPVRATPAEAHQSTETAEVSPASILQGLMERFIFLKENGGKAEAFKALQKSFAMNAAVLSPYFIPLKDLMNLIMELETFIGKSSDHIGKTPEQVIRQYLQSGLVDNVTIASPYPEEVDNSIDNSHQTVSTVAQEG